MEEREEEAIQAEENVTSEEVKGVTSSPFNSTKILMTSAAVDVNSSHTEEVEPTSYWLDLTEPSPGDRDEEFVNGVVPEYEDSNEPGSALAFPTEPSVLPTRLPPILLELRWLPPRPPTSYDGFNVYIYRDGKQKAQGVFQGLSSVVAAYAQ